MSFADVVRRTVSEVKRSEEPDTRVRDHGRTPVIRNKEVLVLKPRCPEGASAMPSSVSVDGLTNVLKRIPVNPSVLVLIYSDMPENVQSFKRKREREREREREDKRKRKREGEREREWIDLMLYAKER